MSGVGRLGKTLLSSYFGLLLVFLYAPLVVLVLLAVFGRFIGRDLTEQQAPA